MTISLLAYDNGIDTFCSISRQYIEMGVFVAGAGVEMVSEEDGMKEVLQCELAQPFTLSAAK